MQCQADTFLSYAIFLYPVIYVFIIIIDVFIDFKWQLLVLGINLKQNGFRHSMFWEKERDIMFAFTIHKYIFAKVQEKQCYDRKEKI